MEFIHYLIQEGRVTDALETLKTYIVGTPYSTDAECHGYLGILAQSLLYKGMLGGNAGG